MEGNESAGSGEIQDGQMGLNIQEIRILLSA
jgi:hypothetical protein